MGSRYGRNKRRQDREQIATLLAVNTRLDQELLGRIGRYERLMDMLRDWDYDVRVMLGEYSALLFDGRQMRTRGDPRDIQRLPAHEPPLMMSQINSSDSFESVTMKIAALHHMWVTFDEDKYARLRQYIRVTITGTRGPDLHRTLALSEGYLKMFVGDSRNPSKRDVAMMAHDIATRLLSEMRIVKDRGVA